MQSYQRYLFLTIFGAFLFIVISVFQSKMYNTNLNSYLKNETIFQKSIYQALILKHNDLSLEIEHVLEIQHKITTSQYFLLNPKKSDITLNMISKSTLEKIINRLKREGSLSYPLEIKSEWYVLSFFKSVLDSDIYIVSLTKSDAIENMQINRIKRFLILISILTILVFLFNRTLLYAQNLKVERDKISLALSKQVKNDKIINALNKTLSENIEYLKIFLDAVPIPIYVKNIDNKYIECNKAYVNISGFSKDEIIQSKTEDLLPEHISRVHAKKDLELLKKDSIHYKEIYNFRNGETIIYEFFKTVLKKNGKYDGYICTMVDVTRHEEQEAYLEKMIDIEVSKNIQQAKTHEQERLRDTKFSAIGQISAGITHEINTPLTYVKGNLEMMKFDMKSIENTILREQLISDTTHLENGLNRIEKIVDSMREMSQRASEAKEIVNVHKTLVTALTLAYNRSKQISKIYLNSKEFNISSSLDEYYCYCELQKQRIEQVWVIIINNALDELEKIENFESRELYIDCSEVADSIHIKFRDNAGGIDTSLLNDIFEPFISNKPQGGMGIGLSIVKKILDEQNATIKAYNDNAGAIFEISIPKKTL